MTLRRGHVLIPWLAAVWGVCVHRAVTQSIVHDEALAFQVYGEGPASWLFTFFNANHHFLHSVLMRLSVMLFGVSEWSIRLPALAGAALYFAAVYRVVTDGFRTTAAALACTALLTINPFILDFMVASRGYGMALGLWMWALALLLRKPGRSRNLAGAGAADGGVSGLAGGRRRRGWSSPLWQ